MKIVVIKLLVILFLMIVIVRCLRFFGFVVVVS